MPIGLYQKQQLDRLKKKAFSIYKQGELTVRDIAPIVGKSYSWVWLAVKELQQKEKVIHR